MDMNLFMNDIIISSSIKRAALAINFTKGPEWSGTLIANHLFLCYCFVISCLRKFADSLLSLLTVLVFCMFLFIFSDFRYISLKFIFTNRTSIDVKPGLIRTNQTCFDV